jgi:hypothetical protein
MLYVGRHLVVLIQKPRSLLAPVFTCGLLLAGCGGGNSASSPANTAGGPPLSSNAPGSSPTPGPSSGAPPSPTPVPTGAHYVSSDPYQLTGAQPYKFLVIAPNGPIPASQQPYEVWPSVDINGELFFSLDVGATGPWGTWTNAQLAAMTVAALGSNGWLISQ